MPDCASWTDTNFAPLRSDTEYAWIFLIQENAATTIYTYINGKTNPILLNRFNDFNSAIVNVAIGPAALAREIAVRLGLNHPQSRRWSRKAE